MPRSVRRRLGVLVTLGLALGCAHVGNLPPGEALGKRERRDAIRRAGVWSPTNVAAMDLEVGPQAEGAFAPNAWVSCEYTEKKSGGRSPKFSCETSPGAAVKVKYGPRNAEVFGEVLATRLFWALGFAADRMYPVRVRCHGCPTDPAKGPEGTATEVVFNPAAIERKLPGRPMETRPESGWSWHELEDVGPDAPEGARAQRDALRLLAAFVQHTDSKPANQRLLCPEAEQVGRTGCRRPVLMVSDLGLTFGHAGLLNRNVDSVSLATWSEMPVWKDPARCVARLARSFTGSLGDPRISEAGRAFLAGLLAQLSDAQLRDLFDSARVRRRSSDPSNDPEEEGPPARVSEWVAAFKVKRAQIVDARCPR